MSNVHEYTGRTRGAVNCTGATRADIEQTGRTRGAVAYTGVSDVIQGGGGGVFDPTAYGTVISYHTARGQAFSDGAAVSSITGDGPNAYVITAPAGSNEATYVEAGPHFQCDGNDYYRAASRAPWDVLHQGAGTVVVRAGLDSITSGDAHILFATATESTSNVGVTCYINDVGGRVNRLNLVVSNGSGNELYDLDEPSSGTTLTAGVPKVFVFAWDGTDARLYEGSSLLTTVSKTAEAFSGAASTSLPTWLAGPASRFDLDTGPASDVICYSDKLDAADVSALVTALEAQYV